MMNFKDKLTDKEIEYEWNWKIEKEIEDLKLIIESKNNQVESKNKHIKRLERIISNMKKNNLIGRDSEQLCCSINFLTKKLIVIL